MKRWYVWMIAAMIFLTACTAQQGNPSTEKPDPSVQTQTPEDKVLEESKEEKMFIPAGFTRKNFPKLDGSTSTMPLGRAIASTLLGEDREQVEDLIAFSRTTQSFRALMDGAADLLIVAEPSPVVFEELEQRGIQVKMEPFATDALIFVVNASNPVDSLTVEQVQKIYTGEITNWSEVGGEDLPIDAFQRNAESGSQVLMEKLVMDGLTMAQPPLGYRIDDMGGLMQSVRGYDNSASAIGYSVYYYASEMNMADGLKILSIDGVSPSADSIRSGAYPFRNPYYVVRRADAVENNRIMQLYDWILSEDGQKLVSQEGYVSVLASEEPEHSGGERAQVVARYWYDEGKDDLIPSAEYGPLVPYIGAEISDEYFGSGFWYGLAAQDGRIITDAVFLDATLCTSYDTSTNLSYIVPMFCLTGLREESDGTSRCVYALAAEDGSWYTGMIYDEMLIAAPTGVLMRTLEGDIVMVGTDGAVRFSWNTQELPDWGWHSSVLNIRGDYLLCEKEWVQGEPVYGYADSLTGTVFREEPEDLPPRYDWGANLVNFHGGSYTWDEEYVTIALDSGAEVRLPLEGYIVFGVYDGNKVLLELAEDGIVQNRMIKTLDGEVVFGPMEKRDLLPVTQYRPGTLMMYWTEFMGTGEILNLDGEVIARPYGYYDVQQYGDRLVFMDEAAYRVTDLAGNDLIRIPRFLWDD
ncbi:MAG: substrate-binding domain-containing protein [Oscillospiraceae bacterium]|nr:substrate-binding domain-containing protein [Oscillospiraceae bacterium]